MLGHYAPCVFQFLASGETVGLIDHNTLGTLDFQNFLDLMFNRHESVYDSDSARACHGNGHRMFGDSIHWCADYRGVQLYVTGEFSASMHFFSRMNAGFLGNE